MRVASYNIRKAVGLDWKRAPDRIMDVLAEIDADVIVLQEADKRVGTRAGVLPLDAMRRDLGYELAPLATRPQSHGWHGNAIFHRMTGVTAAGTTRLPLPSLEPRGAVSLRLAEPGLDVIGVHLGLARRTRLRQVAALSHHLKTAPGPVLIAGDFNAWGSDPRIIETLGPGCELVAPGLSFHASRPLAALDRFVLAGGARHVSSHVHQSELAVRASDHLPIVIELAYPAAMPAG